MQRGLDELLLVEQLAGMSRRVQLGELQRRHVRHVLLEHAQRQHWQRRVEQVVHRYEHLVEHRLWICGVYDLIIIILYIIYEKKNTFYAEE